MADTFTREQRSQIMRQVKSKDTSLELRLRRLIWRRGLRYRVNVAGLPGKPDIVFTRQRIVIFVDSCFFHGCSAHLRRPKSNQEYWDAKIARNILRDQTVNAEYQQMDWQVFRLWEHELKTDVEICADRIESAVLANQRSQRSRET
jgi:DNA mismatch endonuclease (patch repair protein)